MKEGLITVESIFDLSKTIAELELAIASGGMTIFGRIDHAEGANRAGLSLRPTIVLIFGNARAGTPLMQEDQTIGLDLPLKLLVWQDNGGIIRITYNDIDWLVGRHGISRNAAPVTQKMKQALQGILNGVVQR
jgi:uncharacterized protein (DUF302 family)